MCGFEHSPVPLAAESVRSAILRVGLIGCAILCVSAASGVYESAAPTTNHGDAIIMVLTYLVGFTTLVFATLTHPPERTRWLVPLALSFVLLCQLLVKLTQLQQHTLMTTDVQLFMDHAARVLLTGENPYTTSLADAYRTHRAPLSLITPLTDGSFTTRVAYPALAVLLNVPLVALGLPTEWTYLIAFVVSLVLLYRFSPAAWRPLILLPLFIDPRYFQYAAGGVSDSIWALLLLVLVRYWDRPLIRAVVYGVAASLKQQPWLLGPFLLVRLWHDTEPGERRSVIGRFLLLAIFTFALINAPFIAWDPLAWFRGVFEPAIAPMIMFGQGLSALSTVGFLALSKGAHSFLMVLVFAVGLFAYTQHRGLRPLIWIVPGFALFFGARSLTSYWYFFLSPLLLDLARDSSTKETTLALGAAGGRRLRWALWVSAALIGVLVLWGALRSSPLSLQVLTPIQTHGASARRISVQLSNGSSTPIEPRFASKSGARQPLFWRIESGPTRLAAGARARYTLAAPAPWAEFDIRRGTQLIATDKHSRTQRASALIAGENEYVFPDVIPNGRFRFLSVDGRPTFWGITHRTRGSELRVEETTIDGHPRSVLQLRLPAGKARFVLDTYIALPSRPIQVRLWVPAGANRLPELSLLYGLRLMVDKRHVWVLFGDGSHQGKLAGGDSYVMLKSPRGQWSHHTLDLEKLLRSLGLPLAARRVRISRFEHLDTPLVPLNFQIAVQSTAATSAALTAKFGEITTTSVRPDRSAIFQRAQRRPQDALLWWASYNLEMRNYGVAHDRFEAATRIAPRSIDAWFGLAETCFWQKRHQCALDAYGQVVHLDNDHALAYKGIGWTAYLLGRTNEALRAWGRAKTLWSQRLQVSERPHLADVFKGMGLAALRQRRCADARKAFARAGSLNPRIAIAIGTLLEECREQQGPATRPVTPAGTERQPR